MESAALLVLQQLQHIPHVRNPDMLYLALIALIAAMAN